MSTATSTSQASLSCARCGYDLRGLARDANCPECGLPLARSLYGDFLKHQDPRWLQRLRLGTICLAAASVADLIFSGYFLFARGAIDWRVILASAQPLRVAPVAIMATNLLGTLLLTTPQPARRERTVSSRRAFRIAAAVLAVMSMGAYVPLLREPPVPQFWVGLSALTVATTLISGIYLCGLALRIPNALLASHAAFVAVGGALLEILQNLYPWVAFATAMTKGVELPVFRMFPLQVTGWVFGLYALYVITRFHRELGTARAEGEAAAGKSPATGTPDALA